MNLPELKKALEHMIKTTKCLHCEHSFKVKDIAVIATTPTEALLEARCSSCHGSTIVTISVSKEVAELVEERLEELDGATETNRKHQGISSNDVLDVKNFLTTFDGNFKKIFSKKQ